MLEYTYQYNYYLAMLPKAYREVMTFNKWYTQRTYDSVVKMNSLDLSA